jgi:hypothetical protein
MKVCPAQPQPLSLFSISAHTAKNMSLLLRRVQGYGPRVASYGLRVACFVFGVSCCGLRVAANSSSLTVHRLASKLHIFNYELSAISYALLVFDTRHLTPLVISMVDKLTN